MPSDGGLASSLPLPMAEPGASLMVGGREEEEGFVWYAEEDLGWDSKFESHNGRSGEDGSGRWQRRRRAEGLKTEAGEFGLGGRERGERWRRYHLKYVIAWTPPFL